MPGSSWDLEIRSQSGSAADFVAYERDPRQDPGVPLHPHLVVRNGKVVGGQ
jgi:imidazolonepropionase-like amidohydrolase